jgi:hypothetical protein
MSKKWLYDIIHGLDEYGFFSKAFEKFSSTRRNKPNIIPLSKFPNAGFGSKTMFGLTGINASMNEKN